MISRGRAVISRGRAGMCGDGRGCERLSAVHRVVCCAERVMANKWPDSHSFGAAAGLGWFGPPLIASDARMDLVSTLARTRRTDRESTLN